VIKKLRDNESGNVTSHTVAMWHHIQ